MKAKTELVGVRIYNSDRIRLMILAKKKGTTLAEIVKYLETKKPQLIAGAPKAKKD